MPFVSVIIPCYNAEKFIPAALESVRNQTLKEWECIVVDDGSTDESAVLVRNIALEDRRIRVLRHPNQGVMAARNSGYGQVSSESDYVLFLDADDYLEKKMLERTVAYMEENVDVGLVRCDYRFIDEVGNFIKYDDHKVRYVPSGIWVRALKHHEAETPFVSVFTLCGIIPSISLMRRTAYDETSGFDENFGHHHEDADLFLRMALQSKIHYLPEALVRRRHHSGQNTAATESFKVKAKQQEAKLYAKWLYSEDLNPVEYDIVKEAWQFRQGRLEPYLCLLRVKRSLREFKICKALRYLLGGLWRFLLSVCPGYEFPLPIRALNSSGSH